MEEEPLGKDEKKIKVFITKLQDENEKLKVYHNMAEVAGGRTTIFKAKG